MMIGPPRFEKVLKCPNCNSTLHTLVVTQEYLLSIDHHGSKYWKLVSSSYRCPKCYAEYPSSESFTTMSPAQMYEDWEIHKMREQGELQVVTAVCTDQQCGHRWPEIVGKTRPPCPRCGCETRIEPYTPPE